MRATSGAYAYTLRPVVVLVSGASGAARSVRPEEPARVSRLLRRTRTAASFGIEVAPIHRRSKEVLIPLVGIVVACKDPARTQPGVHPPQDDSVEFATDVNQLPESRDRIERRRPELKPSKVGDDERPLGTRSRARRVCVAEMSTPMTRGRLAISAATMPAPQPASRTRPLLGTRRKQ